MDKNIFERNKEFFEQYKGRINEETSLEKMLETVKSIFSKMEDEQAIAMAKNWCKFRDTAKSEIEKK